MEYEYDESEVKARAHKEPTYLWSRGVPQAYVVFDERRIGPVDDDAADVVVSRLNKIEHLAAILQVISTGSGPHSRDPLTHADNCIDAMKALANKALALITTP